MRKSPRIVLTVALALALTITAVAQANSFHFPPRHHHGGHGHGHDDGGTIRAVSTIAPDSLDPQAYYSAQASEAVWLAYTPLLTYKHEQGTAGGTLIPGLATALPTVSADGKTYQLTLRKGLTYSNGKPVKASDFAYTVKRALKLESGAKPFIAPYIQGAEAFDAGETNSISGIVTDDKTGKITIKLAQAYGSFANVLGLSSIGLVPSGTPMRDLTDEDLPPGVGAYEIVDVEADGGYTLKRNSRFACLHLPGIPTGYADRIRLRIVADEATEATKVLNNEADVFDGGDLVPSEMVPQVEAQASSRYASLPTASTYFFFLNTTRAPFDSLKARQAVNTALDREKIAELSGGTISPDCFYLPEGIIGHPNRACPFGEQPDLAKAKQLVAESGRAGAAVEVWTQAEGPRRAYAEYYAAMLNEIGFEATVHPVANSEYVSTISQGAIDPQTGFANWFQDFPNPADFYYLLDGRNIGPEVNWNFSKVDDPFIQSRLISLGELPATELAAAAPQWEELDGYVADQAYVAPFGAQKVPKFYSSRIDFDRAVMHLQYGNDFSTLRIKKK